MYVVKYIFSLLLPNVLGREHRQLTYKQSSRLPVHIYGTLVISFFSLPSLLLFADEPLQENNQTKALPVKVWTVLPDHDLFHTSVNLRFYFRDNQLRAKQLQKTAGLEINTPMAKDTDMIWNLRHKNGEYLYGWIRIPSDSRVLRCKLWYEKQSVFLRIYTENFYNTHKLVKWPR